MRVDRAELQARAAQLADAYRRCVICPARCAVDRLAGELGRCLLGDEGRVYKEFIHVGEEPEVSPTHAIFLAGCNFRCPACSDWSDVVGARDVRPVSPAWVGERIERRRAEGARTVTFVGGTPEVQPRFILQCLAHAPPDTVVVWNGNLWIEPAVLALLDGVVDHYTPDIKAGDARCHAALTGTPTADLEAIFSGLGVIMAQGAAVIVRHLLIPGHMQCCAVPLARRLGEQHPGIALNLMTAYRPFGRADRGTADAAPWRRAAISDALAAVREAARGRLSLRVDGRAMSP